MLVGFAAIALGVAILGWASDQFVIGAMRVALLRRVPSLVVGVVIVGFGTSAPEMLVSALAVVADEPEIAIGNVVGSNLANLSLLLGIGAMIVPLAVDSRTVRREATLAVAAVIAFAVAVQGDGINRWEGALLLAGMVAVLALVLRQSGRDASDQLAEDVVELAEAATHRLGVEAGRVALGLLGTVGSAQLLLWGALRAADRAGLAEGFVGVTLVAVGTSLPELVTVIQSARRSETDLIVGNLLGSNLFNALVVGGLIGVIGGPPVDDASLTVVAALAAVVVALLAAVAMATGRTVSRWEGIALTVGYVLTIPFLM